MRKRYNTENREQREPETDKIRQGKGKRDIKRKERVIKIWITERVRMREK